MADEALHGPTDAFSLASQRAADVFALKIAQSGGLGGAAQVASIARAAGIGLYGGTMLEGAVGTIASAHVFSTFGEMAWGTELFGPLLLTEEILTTPLDYRDFALHLPRGAGLGIALDNRIVRDLFYTIEDLDVTPDEFWTALNYLTETGQRGEYGLLAAGLAFEHFLDVRLDEAEKNAGLEGGTPRTIEGPLYVAGAPESFGHARIDGGSEPGQVLVMRGRVLGEGDAPVAGALVEVWHANHLGNYSFFDKSQAPFNLRGSIRTDAEGRYSFRSVVLVGYSVPHAGMTERLLDQLGRHGHRPAHIHFFVSAPGVRKLTTQIDIDGDPYLWDDFAFATREGLVAEVFKAEGSIGGAYGVEGNFALIDFDFSLGKERGFLPSAEVVRVWAEG
jgi:catechol 1,2-dioxygenase